MFHINNDDIDDMLKKAAGNYELNEEMASDWNGVQNALQNDAVVSASAKETKKRKFYLLWLLFLIPAIALFTYKAGFYVSEKENANKKIVKTTSINNTDTKNKNNLIKKKNNANSSLTTSIKNTSLLHYEEKKLITGNKNHSEILNNETSVLNHENLQNASLNNNSNSEKIISSDNNIIQQKTSDQNLSQTIIDTSATKKIITLQPESKTDTKTQPETTQPKNANKKSKQNNNTQTSFAYVGLTANADLSFVKFQKTSSPGFGIGAIGGYHFKNGISVETGVVFDKKNYYTKGNYFDKSKLGYLQTVNLLSANGNCYMWEIPVTVKYDFKTNKKYNWFVTAGMSSYIMNKEYYNFTFEKDGVIGEHDYDYYHATKNWFSVLNVGAGVNIKTSNKYLLQVQPYFKMPVSGIGKGSLSLNSAGINFSYVRKLH